MQKKNTLQLGYFMEDVASDPAGGYQGMLQMIDEGMILPSLWVNVDEEGEPIGLIDIALGYAEYASFVEVPEDEEVLQAIGVHGISFTPAFLEQQGVECVQYLAVQEDVLQIDPTLWIHDKLEALRENPEAVEFLQEVAKTAVQRLRDDPEKRALLRERIAEHINAARTYNEIVLIGEESGERAPREWRGMGPVHFTLDDVQTVYVADAKEEADFRRLYPTYRGAFAAVGESQQAKQA